MSNYIFNTNEFRAILQGKYKAPICLDCAGTGKVWVSGL